MAHERGQLLLPGAMARGWRVITASRDERSFPYELDSVRAARHFVTAVLTPAGSSPGDADTALDDTGLDDTGLDDTGLDDTGLDDTGLDDTGLDDAGLDDAGLDDTKLHDAMVDDAGIAVTELAANAVLHARSAFTVTVVRSVETLTILVADHTPIERDDAQTMTGLFEIRPGHGLSVVTQLARRWGVDPTQSGKVVWVELPLPPRHRGG